MKKPEFINIFLTQLLKDEYRKHRIKPSKLIRVFGDDVEVDYDTQVYATIRSLVEWTNTFIKNISDYYYNAKLNNNNLLSINAVEIRLSKLLYVIGNITGLLIRNLLIGFGTCIVGYDNLEISFNFNLNGPTILCTYLNKNLIISPSLYKSTLVYNNNDVFFIPHFDPIDGDVDFDDSILYDIMEGGDTQIALLCPHDTYENFVIAYADGNGGYTTDKPENIEFDLNIVDNNAYLPNSGWISVTCRDFTSDEITKLENVLLSIKSNCKKFYSGDFSELSVVDDIVIKLPFKIASLLADLENIIKSMMFI